MTTLESSKHFLSCLHFFSNDLLYDLIHSFIHSFTVSFPFTFLLSGLARILLRHVSFQASLAGGENVTQARLLSTKIFLILFPGCHHWLKWRWYCVKTASFIPCKRWGFGAGWRGKGVRRKGGGRKRRENKHEERKGLKIISVIQPCLKSAVSPDFSFLVIIIFITCTQRVVETMSVQ